MLGLNAEPVVIVNAVRLVCLAAMSFGFHLTDVQLVTSMTALEAVLTIFTRSKTMAPDTLQALTPATLKAAQDASQPVKDTVKKLP